MTSLPQTLHGTETFSFGDSPEWRDGGYAPDMELVCERFRLIETLETDTDD